MHVFESLSGTLNDLWKKEICVNIYPKFQIILNMHADVSVCTPKITKKFLQISLRNLMGKKIFTNCDILKCWQSSPGAVISLTKILADSPLGILPAYQSFHRSDYDTGARRMGGSICVYLFAYNFLFFKVLHSNWRQRELQILSSFGNLIYWCTKSGILL